MRVLRQCLLLALYLWFMSVSVQFVHCSSCPPEMSSLFHQFVLLHGVVVPDGVAGSEADPLRDGAVLLLGLSQLLLGAEGLVGLCDDC